MQRIAAACLLISLSLNAHAGTWYVSPTGNDAATGTSTEAAFRTITRGVEALEGPGDTLIVGPGVFREEVFVEKSGTPDNPITIRAQIPGRTELVGSVRLTDWRPIEGRGQVFVADLDQPCHLVYEKDTDTEYIEVANLRMLEDTPGSFCTDPDAGLIYVHPSDDAGMAHHVVDACVLDYGLASLTTDPGWLHEPRRVGLVIDGFVVRDFNQYGIFIHNADYCAIRNCIAHHCRRGIFINEALRSEITGCEAWSCADRFNREFGNIGFMSYIFECLLEDNIVHDTTHYGIRFYGANYGNIMRGNLAWNCHTGIHIKGAMYDRDAAERYARYSDGGAPNIKPDLPVRFERNVAHQVGSTGLISSASVAEHNTGEASQFGNAVEERSNINFRREETEDARFVAPDWHDLRLQSDSPHIDSGHEGESAGAFPYRDEVFFVGPSGDDANTGTSVAQAWRSLEAACERLQAGQTLYLLPGDYEGAITLRGLHTADDPTIIRPREKGTVTLNAGGAPIAMEVTDCQNLRVEGLRITGSAESAVALDDSEEVTISECEIFANEGDGVVVSGLSPGARIMRNTIAGNGGDGVSIGGTCGGAWAVGNILADNRVGLSFGGGLPPMLWTDHNNVTGGPTASVEGKVARNLADWQALGHGAHSISADPGFVDGDARDFRLTDTSLCRGRGYLGRHIGSGRELPEGASGLSIENVRVVGATSTTADLAWEIGGGPATMLIAWGTDPQNLEHTLVRDTGHYYRTRHLATLTDLTPDTEYYFRVGYRRLLEGPAEYHDFRYAWPERGPDAEAAYYASLPKEDTLAEEVHSFTTPRQGEIAGRVLHVSASGDDGAPGSETRPLRTIARACEMVAPGDRVVIHEGTWHEMIRPMRSGLPDAPIIFEAARGERVVIDGRGELIRHGADLLGRNNITLRGLFFFGQSEYAAERAGGGQVYLVHSDGIRIENCVFDGRMNYVAAITSAWSGEVTVHNNIFVNHHGSIVSHDSEGTLAITRNSFLGPTIYKLYAPRSADLVIRNNLFGENLFPKKKEQYKLKMTSNGTLETDYNCYYFHPDNDLRRIIDWTPPGADLTRITSLPEQQQPGEVTRYGVSGNLELWHRLGRGEHSFIADPKWANPDLIEDLRSRFRGWPDRFHQYAPFSREDVRVADDSPCIGAGEGGVNIGADYEW